MRIKSALNEISEILDSSFYLAAHFSFSHPLTQRALTSINYVKAPVGSARSNSDSNKKRVVKLVSIVILTFTVSWLPLQVSTKIVLSSFSTFVFQVILLGSSFGYFPFSVTKVSLQV